ncbi:MAG TPA: lysozyme inhibitor LprI family protein [Bauldia sp.]|nr:lysozyme inhibitor LprI family protein [Bauldia sp.]
MARPFIAFVILTNASIAVADEPPGALEIEGRVDKAYLAEVNGHCLSGSDLERAFCFKDRLEALDKELEGLLTRALAHAHNMWGDKATEEERQNIREAQTAWKTYRHEHCWFDYVAHQGINASSHQLDNIACEVRRTFRRMEEIKIDYMGDWR